MNLLCYVIVMNSCSDEAFVIIADAYRSPIFLAAGVVYVGKASAFSERIRADCRYAFRYRYASKAFAIIERIIANLGDAFSDCHTS